MFQYVDWHAWAHPAVILIWFILTVWQWICPHYHVIVTKEMKWILFQFVLSTETDWIRRLRFTRANARRAYKSSHLHKGGRDRGYRSLTSHSKMNQHRICQHHWSMLFDPSHCVHLIRRPLSTRQNEKLRNERFLNVRNFARTFGVLMISIAKGEWRTGIYLLFVLRNKWCFPFDSRTYNCVYFNVSFPTPSVNDVSNHSTSPSVGRPNRHYKKGKVKISKKEKQKQKTFFFSFKQPCI